MPISVGVGWENDGLGEPAEDRGGTGLSDTLTLEDRLGALKEPAAIAEDLSHIESYVILMYCENHDHCDGTGVHLGLVGGELELGTLKGAGGGAAATPVDPLAGPAPVEPRRAGDASEQFLAFWALALLGPPILALAGLGSADLWFALAVRLWLAGFAVLAVLVVMNSQGLGALWYAMAEFLMPIMLLGGLGSGFAGLFAWKISAGTPGPAAKGSP